MNENPTIFSTIELKLFRNDEMVSRVRYIVATASYAEMYTFVLVSNQVREI